MLFRFRYLEEGGHTHMRLFAGRSEASLGKCGDLVMRNEEFAQFRDAIECTVDDCYPKIEFKNEEDDNSTLIPR